MLKIENISKTYKTGDFVQKALDKINIEFDKNEFVSILGPSGSGKTTLLNIIGGLDKYTSGDLIINNKSTKKFKDRDWDAYRNHEIGFIFQNYNLISHISVLENVELGMTLSGISARKRKKEALKALERVGLKKHYHKKPNQLSGGQMQRVAIARALANNPDIILADEPTGALDSKTSIQIMELIKEISKDKLVIMVTHNPDLANEYSNRIIRLEDGKIIEDTKNKKSKKETNSYRIKRTSMKYLTALKLSFNNIKTKKARTLLTAFASSIGIIGISLILALSNGFDIQIDKFETDTLSSMPIIVSEQGFNLDEEQMKKINNEIEKLEEYPDSKIIHPLPSVEEEVTHKNEITEDYVNYLEKIDPNLVLGISYTRITNMNLIKKINDEIKVLDNTKLSFISIPKKLDEKSTNGVIEDNYDIISGNVTNNYDEIFLVVDNKNRLDEKTLETLGFDTKKDISFDDIVGTEIKLVLNNEFYKKIGNFFTINNNLKDLYNNKKALTLKISGIIRGKEDKKLISSTSGIAYNESLIQYIIKNNKESEIVKSQLESKYNVLTGGELTKEEKENTLSYLGYNSVPVMINVFPKDFDSKEEIIKYLDKYNEDKKEENKIIYTDLADTISSLSGNIMDAITIVLIAFSAISLIVSSIMIGIITYISVLERTKEIGVLRALGARKKDISRVFNAETFIIGLTSGLIGILIARLLIIPTNKIMYDMTSLEGVAKMNPIHALSLVIISILLTMIGGFIPSKIAAKKDPVEALRSE